MDAKIDFFHKTLERLITFFLNNISPPSSSPNNQDHRPASIPQVPPPLLAATPLRGQANLASLGFLPAFSFSFFSFSFSFSFFLFLFLLLLLFFSFFSFFFLIFLFFFFFFFEKMRRLPIRNMNRKTPNFQGKRWSPMRNLIKKIPLFESWSWFFFR